MRPTRAGALAPGTASASPRPRRRRRCRRAPSPRPRRRAAGRDDELHEPAPDKTSGDDRRHAGAQGDPGWRVWPGGGGGLRRHGRGRPRSEPRHAGHGGEKGQVRHRPRRRRAREAVHPEGQDRGESVHCPHGPDGHVLPAPEGQVPRRPGLLRGGHRALGKGQGVRSQGGELPQRIRHRQGRHAREHGRPGQARRELAGEGGRPGGGPEALLGARADRHDGGVPAGQAVLHEPHARAGR
mmetsp:Transcript_54605/g.175121  ORF Transcript_54605/g.175121 Transcript_54605/m.175121 type:complete len:240 (+) Transcript_54605:36-755(+)